MTRVQYWTKVAVDARRALETACLPFDRGYQLGVAQTAEDALARVSRQSSRAVKYRVWRILHRPIHIPARSPHV